MFSVAESISLFFLLIDLQGLMCYNYEEYIPLQTRCVIYTQ